MEQIALEIRQEDVEILTWLGLTERQAKVYLALLLLGVSKAEAISKASLVHRQEIYRVVIGLQDMGLVYKRVGTPNMYNAIPIDDALKILFNRKVYEFNEIRGKARRLAKKLNRIDSQNNLLKNEPYLNIISGGDFTKFKEATENTREHIDLVTTWKRFRLGFSALEDPIKTALLRGVMINIVTEKPGNEAFPKWVVQTLAKREFRLEIKTISTPPLTMVVIYDNTQVSLCINPTSDLRGAHLWSNNNSMVALSRAYFESMWALVEDKA